MRQLVKNSLFRFRHRTEGMAAVEFAILGTVFLLFIGGIMDLGHAWYMTHLMANASREGARYGTRYATTTTNSVTKRVLPKDLNPSIQDYVMNKSSENGGQGGWGLRYFLPSDANVNVAVGGPGATQSDPFALATQDLSVTITARKNWFLIGTLVPGLGDYKDLSVATTMKCE